MAAGGKGSGATVAPQTSGDGVKNDGPLSQKQVDFLRSGGAVGGGVTARQREALEQAGFDSLASLLQHYPREYLLYSASAFEDGEFVCSQGTVESVSVFCKSNRGLFQAKVVAGAQGEHTAHIKQWFHFRNRALAQTVLRGMKAKYVALTCTFLLFPPPSPPRSFLSFGL